MFTVLMGLLVGFLAAIPPLGPATLLILRRGLQERAREGYAIAAGRAVADGIYCAAALLGLDFLLRAYPKTAEFLQWIGALILIVMGLIFAIRDPRLRRDNDKDHPDAKTVTRQFFLGLTLTGLNPAMLVTWTAGVALVMSLGGLRFDEWWQKLAFPLSVSGGIVLWFALMLTGLQRFGDRLGERTLKGIVRGLGALLAAIGVWYGWRLFADGAWPPGG